MTKLNQFYFEQKEPIAGCLLSIREMILAYDESISERWYYRLPCFFFKDKLISYVWIEQKTSLPYIAFYPENRIDHHLLEKGNRTSSKIMRINPEEDIPIEAIYEIINQSITIK